MADPRVGDPGGDPTRGYLKRQRNSLNSFTATNKDPIFDFTGRNDENDTSFDDVVGLIADLKKIIIEQGNTIKNVEADLAEIKSEHETLINQNNELQDEIRSLRTQLSTCSGSNPAGSIPSPRSWASVAASGGTADTETNLSGLIGKDWEPEERTQLCPNQHTTQPTNGEDTEKEFTRYLPTDSVNSYIRNALLNADTTKDVQILGSSSWSGLLNRRCDTYLCTKERGHELGTFTHRSLI
jgi:hypothetical protein